MHELGHIYLKWLKPEMKDNEDKWIIENLEKKVADVKEQEGTRNNHEDGDGRPTTGPTTDEEPKETKTTINKF